MAYEIPGFNIGTLNATANLSALQYTAVYQTTLGGINGVSSSLNGLRPLGILQNAPTSNQACEIMVHGVSKMVSATTTIVAGDQIISTTIGRGTTWTSGTTAHVFAQVLEGALTSGLMTVLVFPARLQY